MLELKTEKTDSCNGLIFKLSENNYYSNDRIVFSTIFRLQKRQSCNNPECSACGYMKDDIAESMAGRRGIELPKKMEIGALYELVVINVSTDNETGYTDGWDLGLRKI